MRKDVAESIRVLRHIVDHNPKAYLDFYGFGYSDQLEKDLHALIKELSLTSMSFQRIRYKYSRSLSRCNRDNLYVSVRGLWYGDP